MSTPRIGLTTYARDERGHFHLPAEYSDAVRRAGGLPLLLPPGEDDRVALFHAVDALILTGGGDLDPATYGGARVNEAYEIDAERDATELGLARRLVESDMPGMFICRGTQVLNVALGGTLIEHLPEEAGGAIAHRLPPREPTLHSVHLEAGCHLAELLGTLELEPVSWHHQAIRDVAEGLRVVARAPDGVIEAVEIARRPELVAVQWHPELNAATDPAQQRLFDDLVRSARRRNTR